MKYTIPYEDADNYSYAFTLFENEKKKYLLIKTFNSYADEHDDEKVKLVQNRVIVSLNKLPHFIESIQLQLDLLKRDK